MGRKEPKSKVFLFCISSCGCISGVLSGLAEMVGNPVGPSPCGAGVAPVSARAMISVVVLPPATSPRPSQKLFNRFFREEVPASSRLPTGIVGSRPCCSSGAQGRGNKAACPRNGSVNSTSGLGRESGRTLLPSPASRIVAAAARKSCWDSETFGLGASSTGTGDESDRLRPSGPRGGRCIMSSGRGCRKLPGACKLSGGDLLCDFSRLIIKERGGVAGCDTDEDSEVERE